VAILDDVEDFTVGAVFQRVGVGEVHHRELHFLGGLPFAVTSLVVAHFAVRGPPFLARVVDSGDGFTGFCCLAASTGIAE
jgi:hypothetical protein